MTEVKGRRSTNPLTRSFAEQVDREIERQGISQRELAKRLGVSEARVSVLLSGRQSPSLDTIRGVAEALNCDIEIRISRARN